ncbi:hypothetical protein quinque_002453 [Culex quinquefasciatus]
MGLAGFYQRFIKEYSRMTAPITDLLTKENKRFTWTKEAEDGFRELKAVLTSAPILGNPDFSKLFTIESDASDRAFGDYRVIDGRIFRYVKSPNRQTDPRFSWKLLPPRAERKEIITKVHDQAHFVSDGREYSWIRDNYEPSDDDKDVPEQKKKLFEEIKKNLTAAYQRHAKTYNLRTNANCPKYTVGEKVLKQTFDLSDKGKGFCKKLAPKYEPAVVRKVLGKNTYELEDLDGKRFGVYFTNRLKKWHTPQPTASGS